MPSGENTGVRFLPSGTSSGAPGHEFNVTSQQYTLNRVFLDRNTHISGLCIDQRGLTRTSPAFPLGAMFCIPPRVLAVT